MKSIAGVVGVCLFLTGCVEDNSSKEAIEVPAPWFEEQAEQRGLHFHHESGHSGPHLFPEIVAGGAALADVDGDGDLDAYLVQSGSLLGDEAPGNQLFLNVGNGHFEQTTDGGAASDTGYGMGVAAGDYDNDGDVDLYVTNVGPNVLLRNTGNGQFDDVSSAAGVDDSSWGTAAAFLDLDVDGDLDLFVVNYVNWSLKAERDCYNAMTYLADYCTPRNYISPAVDRLYRNNGDGTFTDVTRDSGVSGAFGNGLGIVGADVNNDGLTDIFVANDEMMNQLWINKGNLRFEDEAVLWGCAVDEHGITKAGMGVAASDYDRDGDTDLLVVNLTGQTDSLFRNTGSYFEDGTVSAGLSRETKRYTRFGVALTDFDNDGWLDLYEANGAVMRSRETAATDDFAEPNSLWRGLAGARFEPVHPPGGTVQPLTYTSRGLAIGDVDNDGGLDLLIVNRDGPANLLMNQVGDRGQWVRFSVQNRQGAPAYGAMVSGVIDGVHVYRDVQPAGSYLASNDPRVHFGMGTVRQIRDVVVHWPGGEREEFGNFEAGQIVVLRRGSQ